MRILISITLLLFSGLNLLAEIDLSELKHPVKPMLWKVEGKSLTKPSYLLGSLHLADPRIINLHPAAEVAYLAADTLAVETSMDSEDIKSMIRIWTRKDNQTLEESIGKPLYSQLVETFQSLGGTEPEYLFPTMKTWMAEMIVSAMTWVDDDSDSMDAALLKRAKSDHKECWNLETVDQALRGFDNFTESEQKRMLKDSLLVPDSVS